MDEFENVTETVVETTQVAAPKGRAGLAITGMIFAIVSIVESFSIVFYPIMLNWEKKMLRSSYGGNVIIDTSLADTLMQFVVVFQYAILAVAGCLSIAGLIVAAVSKGSKKGVAFGIVGIVLTFVAMLITIISAGAIA